MEAGFTAGQVSSDGGALLLREADRQDQSAGAAGGLFHRRPSPLLVKHVSEMLSQRIYGLALGYEDLNDHEQLRNDPLLGVLSGKRELEEPLAGKSTLNRLELAGRSARYHKIATRPKAIDRLLADLFIESHATPPTRSCSIWMRPTSRSTAISRSGSFTATTTATAICRCTSSPATSCCARGCGRPTRTRLPVRSKKSDASWRRCASAGPK